jgi:hypothetical protein
MPSHASRRLHGPMVHRLRACLTNRRPAVNDRRHEKHAICASYAIGGFSRDRAGETSVDGTAVDSRRAIEADRAPDRRRAARHRHDRRLAVRPPPVPACPRHGPACGRRAGGSGRARTRRGGDGVAATALARAGRRLSRRVQRGPLEECALVRGSSRPRAGRVRPRAGSSRPRAGRVRPRAGSSRPVRLRCARGRFGSAGRLDGMVSAFGDATICSQAGHDAPGALADIE